MTAEEIRKERMFLDRRISDKEPLTPEMDIAFWSTQAKLEIAAQLAELNANLRAIHPELNLPEECREHKCSYYTHYLAHGSADLEHEGFHAAEKLAESHFAHCQSTKPEGCPACRRHEIAVRA